MFLQLFESLVPIPWNVSRLVGIFTTSIAESQQLHVGRLIVDASNNERELVAKALLDQKSLAYTPPSIDNSNL